MTRTLSIAADAVDLLREIPDSEKPLARLERIGPAALSISELLSLLLECQTDPFLPVRLVARWSTLSEMSNASPCDLLQVDGMTRLRTARLRAALELGKRRTTEQVQERPVVRSPADAAALLMPEMSGLDQEQMRVMLLNTRNRVLGTPLVYQGSLHTTVIRVSELFRDAVRQNAAAMIVAHNHPSNLVDPSIEDIAVTREIVNSGRLLDIDVMDHLILGGNRWSSLKDRGLGFS